MLNFKVLVNNQVGILVLSCVCCHWSFLNNKFEMSVLKLKNFNQYFAKLEKFIFSCLGQIYFCLSKVTCVAH